MNPLAETLDYHSSSGMSELDSLSDSDWLDIASGHGSEDNESISSQSERDPQSLPHSRRSSISVGSSRGEIEAWEGFVYDSSDEVAALSHGMYPMPLAAAGSAELPLGLIPDIVTDQDRAEDERVKEALDQSLIGTLSASRSSTTGGPVASTQTFVRDLRLSFPDPLTSSRDELQRSYEAVTPSETPFTNPDACEPTGTEAAPSADLPSDPGSIVTTPAVPRHEVQADSEVKHDFEIHLYGSSTEYKWTFVQDLLQKIADGSDQFLVNTIDPGEGLIRMITLEKDDEDSNPLFNAVKVYDRTDDNYIPETCDAVNCPSLGVVFLPSHRLPPLSTHTAYLPVLADNDILDVVLGDVTALQTAAEDDWDLLWIPSSKTLHLKTNSKSPIVTHDEIKAMNGLQIHRAVQAALNPDLKKPPAKSLSDHATSVNAVTIFALVSLIMGFAFNTSFPSSPTPTTTINNTSQNTSWAGFRADPNRSSSVILQGTEGKTQLVSSSVKEMALSIYSPGATSLSLTSEIHSISPTSAEISKSKECVSCRSVILSDRPRTTGALLPLPIIALSEVSSFSSVSKPSAVPVASQTDRPEIQSEGSTTTAVGFHFVNSLSEVLGVTTKALVKAVNDDGNDLMEGLDEFVNSIRTQTDELIKQSKGKARALGDQVQALSETLQSRNDRAKTRAKELKKKGEELILSASEQVRDRTNVAKKRARQIRETVEDSEVWRVYQRAQSDWSIHLREKERGQGWSRRCNRRRSRRERRNGKFMNPRSSCN